jgi:magnesium-transporting ATPase (P-type)
MGEKGTDVAREASRLVLMDDNFESIVAAVKMGIRIFDNLQKALGYIFAIHVPIAGLSLIPRVVFGVSSHTLAGPCGLQELIIAFLFHHIRSRGRPSGTSCHVLQGPPISRSLERRRYS